MPLTMVATGEIREISNIRGKNDMTRRLQDLGVVKGEKIQVVGESPDGLILLVKGVKLAINKGLASLISVI